MRREDDAPPVNDLDDSDREMIAKLRALPPEGNEPDWQKLEASIRAEVGDRAPTMWWRNWKWIVPIWALATTAAIALIVVRGHHEQSATPTLSTTHEHHSVMPAPVRTNAPAMWLDGEAVDLDDVDDASLDSLDQAARDALDVEDVSLDELDDAGLDQLESWLEKNKS